MKIILTAIVATMLLVGMVAAAGTPIDLSTLGKKAEMKSSMTPVVITYTGKPSIEPLELGAPTPVTYTPSFSISVSNRTSSQVTLYTPPFSIGQIAQYTPQQMIFGGF